VIDAVATIGELTFKAHSKARSDGVARGFSLFAACGVQDQRRRFCVSHTGSEKSLAQADYQRV